MKEYKDYIPDPDYEGFDGVYVGDRNMLNPPPLNYDLSAMCEYMRKQNKRFEDLTEEEVERFKLK